ncbi:MAG: DUF308 domain-containing protein [PVC group bacterium]
MNDVVMTERCLLTRHWWAPAARGVLAILLGLLALIWPGLFADAFIIIFGVYFLAQGIAALFTAADLRKEEHRGSIILGGLVGVAVGLAILLFPGVFLVIIIWVIAFWALVTGILEMSAAVQLPGGSGGKWLLFFSGVLSVIVGLILLTRPGAGLLAVLWLIGIYAIIAGVTLLGLSFSLRKKLS